VFFVFSFANAVVGYVHAVVGRVWKNGGKKKGDVGGGGGAGRVPILIELFPVIPRWLRSSACQPVGFPHLHYDPESGNSAQITAMRVIEGWAAGAGTVLARGADVGDAQSSS